MLLESHFTTSSVEKLDIAFCRFTPTGPSKHGHRLRYWHRELNSITSCNAEYENFRINLSRLHALMPVGPLTAHQNRALHCVAVPKRVRKTSRLPRPAGTWACHRHPVPCAARPKPHCSQRRAVLWTLAHISRQVWAITLIYVPVIEVDRQPLQNLRTCYERLRAELADKYFVQPSGNTQMS